ncbi:Putative FMN hydrolase; 5-Amino-6-(5'-phosphoribitylamino)uracil phosphatase [Pseudoalteromonas sp. JB197]|nr:Putative FMN hydrolase; 5-Amino-6-(5'-phosphoribitylamino)uracil phosphatase [Pseudoalteromonas sp. JB197]
MSVLTSLKTLTLSLILGASLLSGDTMAEQTSNKPKVLIFDVNETLLDLDSMRASIGEALGGREDLLPLWFSTMLHHSLVSTVIGDYQDFGQIGVASL